LESAAQKAPLGPSIKLILSVEGVRELHPIVRDEVYRIGCEAIRNAGQHSGADELQIKLAYGQNFVLRVSDNGKGMAPDILNQGRAEHYGLTGMRERAARIHGTLRLRSELEAGTEVELLLPGKIAYRTPDSTPEKLTTVLRRLIGKA
jgi:signal transduction histidine kinase